MILYIIYFVTYILYSQIERDTYYKYPVASAILNAGAIALFKRICSQISISYYEVEEIFGTK